MNPPRPVPKRLYYAPELGELSTNSGSRNPRVHSPRFLSSDTLSGLGPYKSVLDFDEL